MQSPPVYNFYFADELNVSRQRKDSRSSSSKSQKLKARLQEHNHDPVKEISKEQIHHAEESLLEGIEQNQFLTSYAQNNKNAKSSKFKPQNIANTDISKEQLNQSCVPKCEVENENETSFLLDTDTYKEICYEQQQKKVAFVSNLDLSSLTDIQKVCEIHEKPFQIVCFEDKTLVCSHCAIFGDHKTHSLAPLKQIQKSIEAKNAEVKEIMADYKNLQLGVKQKAFIQQFIEKIEHRKNDVISTVHSQFAKIKQFVNRYEGEIYVQLQKFYKGLESKIYQTVKRTSQDSNTAAFEQWQKDASVILRQLSSGQISKKKKVNIFLTNFQVKDFIESPSFGKNSEFVSLQKEGNQYLKDIKEQLNLNLDKLVRTADKFNFVLNEEYGVKIKKLINFQCQTKIQDLIEENQLRIIQERMKVQTYFKDLNQSFQKADETLKSIHIQIKQPEAASTVVSMSQSTPIQFMLKSHKKLNSPLKKTQSNGPALALKDQTPGTVKKTLKYKRRETLQDMKKLQQSLKVNNMELNLMQAKSACDQKSQQKRRITPCLKNMVIIEPKSIFVSTATSRINRCKSRDAMTHRHTPSDLEDDINQPKDFKRVKQGMEKGHEPLNILQNYIKSETQTFDLSSCNLNDSEIIYFVQKASKARKIKHLKLSSNLMTSAGLEKIMPHLSVCTMINLSNNKLSETVLDLFLRKKQRIPQLKMLNIANNKISEKKIKEKITQMKKLGIVVTL